MAFPVRLTSKLTGATPSQLHRWRRDGLLIPEVSPGRPTLYSYRDLVALRSMAFLRSRTSSQRLTKAWNGLDVMDLADHPARYSFGTDGKVIFVKTPDDSVVDLTRSVGNSVVEHTFEELFEEFEDFKHRPVVNFSRPSRFLQVHPRLLGGWPTITDTRVPFDAIAHLVDFATVFPADVDEYYPAVSEAAARDAIQFNEQVEAIAS